MGLVLLKKGMYNDDVGDWQSFLRGLNFYYGKIDNDFGELTYIATKKFQSKYDLFPIDGIVGRKTWGKAINLGFNVELLEDDSYYPPKPDFSPILGNKERMKIFGEFDYKASPIEGNPERIIVEGDWREENIVYVELPALAKATNGKHKGMYFHKLAKEQLIGFFAEIEKEGLHELIISFAGSYVPRFIRGSRTVLSNHSWGTAFDINAWQNWLNREPAQIGEEGCLLKLVPIANKWGFYWGGHFTRKDGMHFEIAKLM